MASRAKQRAFEVHLKAHPVLEGASGTGSAANCDFWSFNDAKIATIQLRAEYLISLAPSRSHLADWTTGCPKWAVILTFGRHPLKGGPLAFVLSAAFTITGIKVSHFLFP